ncbi:MAG: hypothetical protein ACOCP8_04815, partial [archaeon]
SEIRKNDKQIVIISQGSIGDKLAKVIFHNWDILKDFEILYKLHPGEFDKWKDYPYLKKLNNRNNIEIYKDADLYELLAESRYQIGVYSTAIYEGIAFKCKTLLANLPGIEYMEDLINTYNIQLFDEKNKINFSKVRNIEIGTDELFNPTDNFFYEITSEPKN